MHHVVDVVDDKRVVTRAAHHRRHTRSRNQRVITATSDQGVVTRIAGNDVVEGVTREGEVGIAGAGEIFYIGREGIAYRSHDGIDAPIRFLNDDIPGIVYHERVIPCPADQCSNTRTRDQRVVAAVGGDHVVQIVTREGEIGTTRTGQILHVAWSHIAHRGQDSVDVAASGLCLYHIVDVIHHKCGIPSTANHRCHARSRNQRVVAAAGDQAVITRIADNDIIEGVTRESDVATADAGEVLYVGGCRVAHRRLDSIDAGGLRQHHIIDVVDDERVVARAAGHGGQSGACNQRIVAIAHLHPIHVIAAQQQVIAIAGEYGGVSVARVNRVVAITHANHIVPSTTGNQIVAVTHQDNIVASPRKNRIVAVTGDDHVVAATGINCVVSITRQNEIVAVARIDDVIAVTRMDDIVAIARKDHVVAIAGGDVRVSRRGRYDIVAGTYDLLRHDGDGRQRDDARCTIRVGCLDLIAVSQGYVRSIARRAIRHGHRGDPMNRVSVHDGKLIVTGQAD